jgi:hypothetical protein
VSLRRPPRVTALAIALAAASGGVAPATADAAFTRTPAAAGVRPAFPVRADVAQARNGKKRAILVRSVRIGRTGATVLRVDCPKGCTRRAGPAPRISHPNADTLVRRLDVTLSGSRKLRFRIFVPGGTSRFLTLGVRRRKLVVATAGCLGPNGKPAACPPRTAQPPITPPTHSGDDRVIPIPGADPRGALLSVQRIDASRVRLIGWARDDDVDHAAVPVRALVDGRTAGEAAANQDRVDIGTHGFDFEALTDELSHTICVTGINLAGGADATLGACRTVGAFADLTGDGLISCPDMVVVRNNAGKEHTGYAGGDLNADGIVNIFDMVIMRQRMNSDDPCS